MRHVCKEQNDSNHAVSTLQNEKRNKRKIVLLLLFVHCFWLFFQIYISKLCNRRWMGKHRNVQKIANFQLKKTTSLHHHQQQQHHQRPHLLLLKETRDRGKKWEYLERKYILASVRLSNVRLENFPLFSMWLAVTDSLEPTRSLHICERIYDQVVSGLCPGLGNTTQMLQMEEKLITSAGARPALSVVVQNKLAGNLIYVKMPIWWRMFVVYRLLISLLTCHCLVSRAHRHTWTPSASARVGILYNSTRQLVPITPTTERCWGMGLR